MTQPDRRHDEEGRARLDKRMTELTIGVVGMKGAMEGLSRALQSEVDDLKNQLDRQRRLSKYARRTWFEMMLYILLVGLLVSDVGREYCYEDLGSARTFPRTCDTIFWTTDHGGGVTWRIVGFVLQATICVIMWKRSQVPDDLFADVPVAQVRRERRWRRRS